MKKTLVTLGVAALTMVSAQAQLLITQYYEGSSGTNKWIELTNVGGTLIDFTSTSYQLQLWSNANTEAYKSDGTPSATFNLSTGSLASGISLIIGNSQATPTPTYVTSFTTANSVANFSGNDSISLTLGTGVFATTNIVDAIGFTEAGNQGVNTSFSRLSTAVGWNTTAGSNVTTFASVWSNIGLAAADSASPLTDPRIGFSAIPEPSTWALIGLGLGFALWSVRRKRHLA
jgi:predicted extracellular nuclease